jgi:outer membrane receptor for ferrienterochelin and colicin
MHAFRHCRLLVPGLLITAALLGASIFANVRGIVHDPQHRPIAGAQVRIRAVSSAWQATAVTLDDGSFQFPAVPIGGYRVVATGPGFAAHEQRINVTSGASPILHIALNIAAASTTVEVHGGPEPVDTQSSAAPTTIDRRQIAQTPGVNQANSVSLITDFVPGAYVVHDQLHIRGGHQVTWMLDGVPVPNTNIASNVGPQFDPKDIDTIEVQRGGYSAEYGDRTYGVFNVVTRSGFERNNEGELAASYGSQNTTDNQLSFGSHTEKFAYYASLSGNRSDLGLETPVAGALHDQAAGLSTFASLIYNRTSSDQLRFVTSLRGDHYQVPNTPEQQQAGVRDVENERDAFANFTWLHTWSTGTLLTLSPFYHFNRAHYEGECSTLAPVCADVVPDHNRASHYAGGVVTLGVTRGRHNAHLGLQGFAQHDRTQLALRTANSALRQGATASGSVTAAFIEEQFKAASWLTLNGGLRLTHFAAALNENAADPRIGAAITIPKLHWVLRGFYGRYYQAPPLLSVGGPLLELAAQQGFGFLPLRGERDEQHEFGLTIPVLGWTAEITQFRTAAKNFFDHDVLGNSNIFFPVTLNRARIRGWEVALRSPQLFGNTSVHVAYSRQTVQGQGGVTGGLTDFEPPEGNGLYFLDHDQRHTLSSVISVSLPRHAWASGTVSYGSGFLDGDGPGHLPSHATVNLSFGKTFGEFLTLRITGLNIANGRYLIDNSNTFGGTHWANPRRIMAEVKYRFRY